MHSPLQKTPWHARGSRFGTPASEGSQVARQKQLLGGKQRNEPLQVTFGLVRFWTGNPSKSDSQRAIVLAIPDLKSQLPTWRKSYAPPRMEADSQACHGVKRHICLCGLRLKNIAALNWCKTSSRLQRISVLMTHDRAPRFPPEVCHQAELSYNRSKR